jgi:hypothetical protein
MPVVSGKAMAELLSKMSREAIRQELPSLSSEFARRLDEQFDRVFPKKPKGDTGNNPRDT